MDDVLTLVIPHGGNALVMYIKENIKIPMSNCFECPSLENVLAKKSSLPRLLQLDDVIDLVIPRGGSALVMHIMEHNKDLRFITQER